MGREVSVRPLQVLIANRRPEANRALASAVASFGNAEVADTCHNATEVLNAGSKLGPDVAIIDLDLCPDASLVQELSLRSPSTRIIAVADRHDDAAKGLVGALAGGAVGAVYKEEGFGQLERALQSSSTERPVVVEEATGLLLGSYIDALTEKRHKDMATIKALVAAVETRDCGTGSHQHRAAALAASCLERIDLDLAKREDVRYGFMLHDIGKIGVSDAILNKPGPLERHEWSLMQRHPEMGVTIVEPIGFPQATTDIILRHHERWDGSGYPDRLSGDSIPLAARTFAIADAFDAMTSDRPYRPAMTQEAAVETIHSGAGKSFDPDIVEVFLDLVA